MRAMALAAAFEERREQLAGWSVMVADVKDLEGGETVEAYHIKRVVLDEGAGEIKLVLEYPDRADGQVHAMSVAQFIESLSPLVADHPDFAVEASVEIELVIAGQRWRNYDMPVRGVSGNEQQQLVVLGVEGLSDLEGMPLGAGE